jgi:TolB-like protein/Tfp pilus assembly protein PilF/predicted Ser/Thr protein kinase
VTDDRWQRVKELMGAALERPAEARESFLREVCGNDEGLRREIESLLAARGQAGAFLSEPASLSSSRHLSNGTRLGPYEVVGFLGAGGMGEVYKARDTRLDRTVAIKMLPGDFASDAERARRFEREARTISKLNHPHICALYDVGQHDGSTFLVMEYLEGESLAERLRKGLLPLEEALRYAGQIAEALAEAHQQGIVHRDLKPANVMLTRKEAKLLDFGIAKVRAVSEQAPIATATEATAERVIVGTPQYMSPEQLEGKPVDGRTDVFAFGVLLYQMITGRKPFQGASTTELIAAIVKSEPPPISPSAPRWLDDVVRRCLAKDPADRWPSFAELLASLDQAHQPPARRRVVVLLSAVATVAVIAAAVGVWTRRGGHAGVVPTAEASRKSIAVLPFQNLSADPENAYFAEGMTEDILTQLAKIHDLKVIARTSVMRYKDTRKPVREIASELGVATVLEGSVRRAANRVRITGQLIDASTEEQLWAETYDRELADVFAIQSEVAQRIAAALKASLTPEDEARIAERPTGNIEAYDLYVKGRALYYHYRKEDNEEAIDLFRRALAADPQFALAQAGLSDGLMQRQGRFGGFEPADLEAAEAAARKAVELNPHLAEAHKALALTMTARGRLHDALAENERSVELQQGTGFVAVANLANCLLRLGRFDEALAWGRRSAEHDPTSVVTPQVLGNVYDAIGETAPAEATLRRAMEVNPRVGAIHTVLMTFALRHQRPKKALAVARNALNVVPDDPHIIKMAGVVELVSGHYMRARELLQRVLPSLARERAIEPPDARLGTYVAWLDTKEGDLAGAKELLDTARAVDQREIDRGNEFWIFAFDLACVSAIEGNKDEAFRWLDKAYDAGWRGWPQASWSPLLDPLRQDARFQALMRRIDDDVAAMRRRAGLG